MPWLSRTVKPIKYCSATVYFANSGGNTLRVCSYGRVNGAFTEWSKRLNGIFPPRNQSVLYHINKEEADILYEFTLRMVPIPANQSGSLNGAEVPPSNPQDQKFCQLLQEETTAIISALAAPQLSTKPEVNYTAEILVPAEGGPLAYIYAPKENGIGTWRKPLSRSFPAQPKPWFQRVVVNEPATNYFILLTVTPTPVAQINALTASLPATAEELKLAAILDSSSTVLQPSQTATLEHRYTRVVKRQVDTNSNGIPDWWEISHNYNAFVTSGPGYMDPYGNNDGDEFTNIQEFRNGGTPAGIDWSGYTPTASLFVCMSQSRKDSLNYLMLPPHHAPDWPSYRAYRKISVDQTLDCRVTRSRNSFPSGATSYKNLDFRNGYGVRFSWAMADDVLSASPDPSSKVYRSNFCFRNYIGQQPAAITYATDVSPPGARAQKSVETKFYKQGTSPTPIAGCRYEDI